MYHIKQKMKNKKKRNEILLCNSSKEIFINGKPLEINLEETLPKTYHIQFIRQNDIIAKEGVLEKMVSFDKTWSSQIPCPHT